MLANASFLVSSFSNCTSPLVEEEGVR
jgi:hypothetical protein